MKKIRSILFNDLTEIEKVFFPIVLLLVIYGFFLAIVNPKYYQAIYTLRNGFICSLQQLILFIMIWISAYRAYILGFLQKKYFVMVVWLVFALIFVFGFGEKIRWGQFIFEITPSDFFKQNNTQGQITIHNLKFGSFRVNKIIFGQLLALFTFVYVIIFPWLYQRKNKLAQYFGNILLVPVPKKKQILWYLVTVIIALLIPNDKRGELVQLSGVWAFCAIFCFPRNLINFPQS